MGHFVAKYENFEKNYKSDFRDKEYRGQRVPSILIATLMASQKVANCLM